MAFHCRVTMRCAFDLYRIASNPRPRITYAIVTINAISRSVHRAPCAEYPGQLADQLILTSPSCKEHVFRRHRKSSVNSRVFFAKEILHPPPLPPSLPSLSPLVRPCTPDRLNERRSSSKEAPTKLVPSLQNNLASHLPTPSLDKSRRCCGRESALGTTMTGSVLQLRLGLRGPEMPWFPCRWMTRRKRTRPGQTRLQLSAPPRRRNQCGGGGSCRGSFSPLLLSSTSGWPLYGLCHFLGRGVYSIKPNHVCDLRVCVILSVAQQQQGESLKACGIFLHAGLLLTSSIINKCYSSGAEVVLLLLVFFAVALSSLVCGR